MKLSKIMPFTEFLPYFFVGLTATLIDWGLFWVGVTQWHVHYEIALVIGYLTAGGFHYFANKRFTFKCSSQQISSQLSVYILVNLSSLALSIVVMALLVQWIRLDDIAARVITTAMMLVPNYFFHKHITFNRKIFSKHSPARG